MISHRRFRLAVTSLALLLMGAMTSPALAGEGRSGGRLLLTNGVTTVEGASGGGLASWALISGNETKDGIGGAAHVSEVALPDFDLRTFGLSVGFYDRLELSYAHQRFDTHAAGAALGLGRGFLFGQDIFGAKVRLVGDAVWDQDRWLPQISVGVQHKIADQTAILHAVGARRHTGTDFYISATKVLLAQGLVVDATARLTDANQLGLLGFGGDARSGRSVQFEGSAGKLLTRNLLLGAEYRSKPDNLKFAREDDGYDLFAAWAFSHNATVTLAYVDLGSIATVSHQRGVFLSLQGAF
jgi:hypothetical protein